MGQANLRRAQCMEKMGQWNSAMQFYTDSLPFDPAAAYNGMAMVYDSVGMRVTLSAVFFW